MLQYEIAMQCYFTFQQAKEITYKQNSRKGKMQFSNIVGNAISFKHSLNGNQAATLLMQASDAIDYSKGRVQAERKISRIKNRYT